MAEIRKTKLNVAQIKAGMRLAEPITNSSGVTLMPAGIRLTPMFISRIKKWNIESLDVLVEEERPPASAAKPVVRPTLDSSMSAEQEEFVRSVAAEVSKRFLNVKDDPLMMELRIIAVKKLIAHGPTGFLNRLRRNAAASEGQG